MISRRCVVKDAKILIDFITLGATSIDKIGEVQLFDEIGEGARSCKRSDTLFQKSLLLYSTWREYTTASQKSKDLNKVPLLLQDLDPLRVSHEQIDLSF